MAISGRATESMWKKKQTWKVNDKPSIEIKEDTIANKPGSGCHKFPFACEKQH